MSYSVNVYGRDVICASCVNAPSSKDTHDWLDALFQKKFPNEEIKVNYIDMDNDTNLSDYDQELIEQVNNDELFYPLVTINDEIVQDGYVQLKPIIKWFETKGLTA